MGNTKRILSITCKRLDDTAPDTSYLGEYSYSRTSEFSIDRRHTVDCASQEYNRDTVNSLERAISHLNSLRDSEGQPMISQHDCNLSDAIDLIVDAQDELMECDCDGWGDAGRRGYEYFNPSSNYVDASGNPRDGLTADEVKRYVLSDYQRMEGLRNGDWGYIGVRAEAEIVVDGISQTVTSGGLWGIESDSDAEHLASVDRDELADLRSILHSLGFSKRAIATAVKNAEVTA